MGGTLRATRADQVHHAVAAGIIMSIGRMIMLTVWGGWYTAGTHCRLIESRNGLRACRPC